MNSASYASIPEEEEKDWLDCDHSSLRSYDVESFAFCDSFEAQNVSCFSTHFTHNNERFFPSQTESLAHEEPRNVDMKMHQSEEQTAHIVKVEKRKWNIEIDGVLVPWESTSIYDGLGVNSVRKKEFCSIYQIADALSNINLHLLSIRREIVLFQASILDARENGQDKSYEYQPNRDHLGKLLKSACNGACDLSHAIVEMSSTLLEETCEVSNDAELTAVVVNRNPTSCSWLTLVPWYFGGIAFGVLLSNVVKICS